MIEHLRGREKALEPLGWTGREAEWIALVCLHSGVFTRAQFCYYFDAFRNRAQRFVEALIERRSGGRTRFANLLRGSQSLPYLQQADLPGARRLRTSATGGGRPPAF